MSDELGELLKKAKMIAESRTSIRINTPEDIAALYLCDLGELEQEELWVSLLNSRNEPISKEQVYKGSVNCSLIRIGEIFREAIRKNAAAMVVVHNHPSGDPSPSPEDIGLTKALVEAGKLLDVEVLDHIVIGKGVFVSLKAKGLGF